MFNVVVICKQPIKYSSTILNVLKNLDEKKTIIITKDISELNFDYQFLKKYYIIDADFRFGFIELITRLIIDFIRFRKIPKKSILFNKYDLAASKFSLHRALQFLYLQLKARMLNHIFRKKLIMLFDVDSVLYFKDKINIRSNIIYFDLELRLETDLGWEDKVMSLKHEKVFFKIKKIIIQSEERLSIFKRQYHLDKIDVFLFPVCLSSKYHSNGFFLNLNSFLKIGDNEKVIVHIGGILKELEIFEMIKEMLFIRNYHFVFIGYSDQDYLEYIDNNLSLKDSNVHFINPNFDSPDELEQLIRNTYAGIAWYNNSSSNMTTAILSSGKIALYAKLGLPIITNNYISFQSILEKFNFGIGMSNLVDLSAAIKHIEENYDTLSKNSKIIFNKKYNLDYYLHDFKKFINS